MSQSIFIGFDPRPHEVQGYAVARNSIRRHLTQQIPVRGLVLDDLMRSGLYTRPITRSGDQLADVISKQPMSNEFSLSRFVVPFMVDEGFALYVDGDVMARESLTRLFKEADASKAVQVVKHDYKPATAPKMDGRKQTTYARKNWSSVTLWNIDHPGNHRLTLNMVNSARGLWLHQFGWLKDEEIGELSPKWNWLVGYSDPNIEPGLVHFTDGLPSHAGYEDVPYAEEWRSELKTWASR